MKPWRILKDNYWCPHSNFWCPCEILMNFGSVAAALSENRPQYFTADFNHALSVTPCDIMLLQSMSKELVGLVIQDYMLDMMAMSPWKPPKKKHQFLIHLTFLHCAAASLMALTSSFKQIKSTRPKSHQKSKNVPHLMLNAKWCTCSSRKHCTVSSWLLQLLSPLTCRWV